jgi:hypothetical protein
MPLRPKCGQYGISCKQRQGSKKGQSLATLFGVVMLFLAKPDFHVDLKAMNSMSRELGFSPRAFDGFYAALKAKTFRLPDNSPVILITSRHPRGLASGTLSRLPCLRHRTGQEARPVCLHGYRRKGRGDRSYYRRVADIEQTLLGAGFRVTKIEPSAP